MTTERHDLAVRLLGPVRAWRHGAEVALGPARRRAVLGVLARHPDRPVAREELVRAVWGENPPASATGNVYTYVSALRQAIEPGRDRGSAARLLTSGGGSYRLHVPGEAVDVVRFEALRERARRHRSAGDVAAELAALAAARSLWHGPALAGLPGPFAAAERLRLAELLLAVSQRHAELLIGTGRPGDAVAGLRRLAAAYPLREGPHALLMTALHRDGRPAEALRVHDELRELLVERTGTEPGAELRAVRDDILGGPPAPPPAPRPEPGRPVGREPHLAHLAAAVADVVAGRGGALWITGEPGSGKSRLLAEGLRGVLTAGGRPGWAMGDELSRRTPLGLLLDCLAAAAPDRVTHAAVQRIRADAADPARANRAVERAVAVVREIAAGTPLVLIADNLHRADDATVRAWRALRPLTRELPVLLVATCRPEPAGSAVDRLRHGLAAAGTPIMTLEPLADDAAAEVVRRRAPDRPAADVRRIVAEAGGNPRYLELLAAGPATALTAAVGAHLDRFGEPARQALRAVAFLGACTVAELAVATGRPADSLRHALAAPAHTGVLTTGPDDRLRFRHPVVARVLHDGTPAALRAMLHRAFADRVTRGGGDPRDFRYPVGARPVSPAPQ